MTAGMPPVRLCCGQRHDGVQCPDGKVMCCLCFDRFEVAGLSLDDGDPIRRFAHSGWSRMGVG